MDIKIFLQNYNKITNLLKLLLKNDKIPLVKLNNKLLKQVCQHLRSPLPLGNGRFTWEKLLMIKNTGNAKYRFTKAASYLIASAVVTVSQSFTPAYFMQAYAYTEKKATVSAVSLNIRVAAGDKNRKIATLRSGTELTIIDETTDSGGNKWYKVRFGEGETGYAISTYIQIAESGASYTPSDDFEKALNEQGFPEEYKEGLRKVHAQYPNWVFKAQPVDIDWQTVIENESVIGRNLVHKDSVSSWKSVEPGAYDWKTSTWPGFDTSAWVAANEAVIRYYMDPRNFLDPVNIFQFLNQGYSENKYDVAGIEEMVRGTYLESKASNSAVFNASRDISPSSDGQSPGGSSNDKNSEVSLTAPTAVQPEKKEGETNNSGISLTAPTASAKGNVDYPQNQDNNTAEQTQATADPNDPSSQKDSSVRLEAPQKGASKKQQSDYGPIAEVNEQKGSESSSNPSDESKISYSELYAQNGPGIWLDSETGKDARSAGIDRNAQSSDNRTNEDTNYTPVSGDKTYVDMILEAAVVSGVNPYVLTSMLIQEQGREGKSGLISGTTEPYKGIYNYFNVQAYEAAGMSPTQRGLWWASQSGSYGRPWDSRDKAITGGAIYYGDNYVKARQETFYLKKFNVLGTNLYKHQYMTNVEGAADEGARLSQAYSESMKKGALVFSIPVYKNMPKEKAKLPTGNGSPNNKLASLSVEGYSLEPEFSRDVEKYSIEVSPSITSINIAAASADSKAAVNGGGAVNLSSGNNTFNIEVKAENGNVRNYVINVVRKEGAAKQNNTNNNQSNNSGGTSTELPKLVSPEGDGR